MALDPDSLARAIQSGDDRRLPPVHLWNPDCMQDIGMRIGRDGRWYYQGSVIDRIGMVRLFSSILRRDGEAFFLVTPAEKVLVQVDLAPFIAVNIEYVDEADGPAVAFQTNMGDVVIVDTDHPLWVEEDETGPLPFVRVRGRLDALLSRSVFYELAESAASRYIDGEEVLGVSSRGRFWTLGPVAE